MNKRKSKFGYIDYLSSIMLDPNSSLKNNGAVFDCSENSRLPAKKLCFLLSNSIESKKRSGLRYVGHGAFGTVYIIPVGRGAVAIKHVEMFSEAYKQEFEREINYQRAVSAVGIAPQVYDYFYCKCNGKLYGTFIMDYLAGYSRDYQIYNNINRLGFPASYVSQIILPVQTKIKNIC